MVWPLCWIPNSLACLTALMVSPPALARPITFDFGILRLRQERGEIRGAERMLARAQHLAAVLLDVVGGLRLDTPAERVIDRDEVL